MKKSLCIIVLGGALVAIHAIMIKRAIQLESQCGCLCTNCDNEKTF
ncbi:MAG: hypothetical protein ACI31M_00485 [Bacilli bacterium]